jgi:hypothetical protein
MNIDKLTAKIALISLVLALIWVLPAIKTINEDPENIVIGVIIRTIFLFAVIRFVLFLKNKNKKGKK